MKVNNKKLLEFIFLSVRSEVLIPVTESEMLHSLASHNPRFGITCLLAAFIFRAPALALPGLICTFSKLDFTLFIL